jgi:uncharacterized protein YfaT (DUF1175 family)
MLNLLVSAAPASPPARLHSPADRTAFRRWFTFLAESRYYARAPLRGVSDAGGLLRWAYSQALRQHNARWYRSVELPLVPVMPSVCRVDAAASKSQSGAFTRFYVSRNPADAEPGELLMYRRDEPEARLMIYIGASQVFPSPKKCVIYQVNSPNGVNKVSIESLVDDPSPEWRPSPENPDFLGVWRLGILGEPE